MMIAVVMQITYEALSRENHQSMQVSLITLLREKKLAFTIAIMTYMAAKKMGIGKNFIRPSLMPDKTYEEVK